MPDPWSQRTGVLETLKRFNFMQKQTRTSVKWQPNVKGGYLTYIAGKGLSPHSLPNFSGPAGAFRARTFDAALFFLCIWDNLHQKFGGRSSHAHVVVRKRKSTVR
eukprot:1152165-Pelagomonas_calceolata.AAC.4